MKTIPFTSSYLIRLKQFLQFNKNDYLLSNAYNVEILNFREQTMALAIFGISILFSLTSMILTEYEFTRDPPSDDPERLLYLYFLMLISIVGTILCVIKFYFRVVLLKKKGDLFQNENIFTTQMFAMFLFEIAAMMIHPSPFFVTWTFSSYNDELGQNIEYPINDTLIIIGVFRMLYTMLEIFKSTKYNSTRIQRINLMFNSKTLSNFLPIKNFITNHPFKFMIFSFLFSLICFSYIILLIERPSVKIGNVALSEWSQVFWYVMVTMMTIGYGDKVAKTLLSRFIVIILVIWGNFWSSIFLSSIYPYIQLTLREEKAFNQIRRMSIKKEIKDDSSKIVLNLLRLNSLSLKPNSDKNKIRKINEELFDLIKSRREYNKELKDVLIENKYFVDNILSSFKSVVESTEEILIREEKIYEQIKKVIQMVSKNMSSNHKGFDKDKDILGSHFRSNLPTDEIERKLRSNQDLDAEEEDDPEYADAINKIKMAPMDADDPSIAQKTLHQNFAQILSSRINVHNNS